MAAREVNTDQMADDIVALVLRWADGDSGKLNEAIRIITKTLYLGPERVYSIYSGDRGTVEKRTVPGYAWVIWDDGRRFPVSDDSIAPESELEETA